MRFKSEKKTTIIVQNPLDFAKRIVPQNTNWQKLTYVDLINFCWFCQFMLILIKTSTFWTTRSMCECMGGGYKNLAHSVLLFIKLLRWIYLQILENFLILILYKWFRAVELNNGVVTPFQSMIIICQYWEGELTC